MAIKMYTAQYAGLLQDVFVKKQHFLNTFGGKLQVKDGITNSDEFMKLKISDESVNLIVTLPPYPMIKMWDEMFSTQDPEIEKDLKSEDGMAAFLKMPLRY